MGEFRTRPPSLERVLHDSRFFGILTPMNAVLKVYAKNPDFVGRDIADEFILVPIRQHLRTSNSIYVLNQTGAGFWRLLDGKRPVTEIVRCLSEEFEASEDQLARDLAPLIDDLVGIQAVSEASLANTQS